MNQQIVNQPVDTRKPLIEVRDVSKRFPSAEGGEFTVIDNVSLKLYPGEVVALLGKSGSGKSTLLRMMAGLMPPTEGQVFYRGRPLTGANPGVSMVFQSFALMPWLTVQQNVELGLRAAGMDEGQRSRRALEAIDQIGLDGFETAFPRELSGGMKQRVGFARALVMQPDVLVMDEAFSALDVLTTENLRSELVSMWAKPAFADKCVCLVTHNIEEAVLLADRIFVLGSNPGRILTEVHIGLPRPRDRKSTQFENIESNLFEVLTGNGKTAGKANPTAITPLNTPIPEASVGGMAGLVEMTAAAGGSADLTELADNLSFEVDDLLPLVDAAQMLGLLTINGVNVTLTQAGKDWASADVLQAKQIFAHQAVNRVPLVKTIYTALKGSQDGQLREDFFRDLLRRGYTSSDAEEQLARAIDWGRYGELYEHEAHTENLILTA